MELRSIIGKTAHRHSLLLKNEKANQFYLLWGIVDVVEPDMQDFPIDKRKMVCERSHDSSEKNPYNLYYTEDVITINEAILKDAENAYIVDNDSIKMLSPDGFRLYPNSPNSFLPSFDGSNNLLRQMLPKRDCGCGVHVLRGNSATIDKLLKENKYLMEQLAELSCRFLHTDVGRYTNVLGNIYITHYHSEFRTVDWRVCPSLKGLLGKIKYRKESGERYKCFATNTDRNGLILESSEVEFHTGDRFVFIPFHTEIDQIDITIVDAEGQIVYTKEKMAFIKSISIGMGINSVNVALKGKDKNGNETTELIPKYSSIRNVIGKGVTQDNSFVADTKSFEQAEKELRFIFFDGDKDRKEDNLKKAHAVLMEIQNTANPG